MRGGGVSYGAVLRQLVVTAGHRGRWPHHQISGHGQAVYNRETTNMGLCIAAYCVVGLQIGEIVQKLRDRSVW